MNKVNAPFALILSICLSVVIFFHSSKSHALSCGLPLSFIVHCKSNSCDQGFFVFAQRTGEFCGYFLKVDPNQKVYKFTGNPKEIGEEESWDGFYELQAQDPFTNTQDLTSSLFAFKLNETEGVGLKDAYKYQHKKIEFPEGTPIQEVINYYAQQGENGRKRTEAMKWLLPIIMLALIVSSVRRFKKKYHGLIILALIIATFAGLAHVPYGFVQWMLSGIAGFIYLIGLSILKLYQRFVPKRVAENPTVKKTLRIFKYTLSTLFILYLCLEIRAHIPAAEIDDSVYISNVDFVASSEDFSKMPTDDEMRACAQKKFSDLSKPLYKSNFHWLKDGNSNALVYLTYLGGAPAVSDDIYFSKLTIMMPNLHVGEYNIDNSTIRAFYSSGNSTWPHNQWGGPIPKGTVQILKNETKKVVARIKFIGTYEYWKEPKIINFDKEVTFTELPFSEATPWFGKKGEDAYSETFRKVKKKD